MNNFYKSKVSGLGVLGLAVLAMTGCMGTKNLSAGITDDGRVQQQNIVFPQLEDAWKKEGQFPNSENLAKIRPGIVKPELYQLIGRPHFSEAQHAREWDYIMKFYMPDESVKICQYKVIFDTEYKGQEFYWSPADCPPQTAPVIQAPTLVTPPVQVETPAKERINISADALFRFDKWKPENMLPKGKQELNELAGILRQYQAKNDPQIVITGHTDYKGDDVYNMNLSLLRAQTVRNYLSSQGINPSNMLATGAGESQPVKQCSSNLNRIQEIECLQPNRRVTIDLTINR